jgi:protein TonB
LRTQIKWYFLATMVAYFFTTSALIAGGIMLMNPQLKEQLASATLVTPPPPPPPPPAGTGKQPPMTRLPEGIILRFTPPTVIPRSLPPAVEELPEVGEPGGMPGGVPGGSRDGELGGVAGGVPGSAGPITVIPPLSPPTVEALPPTPPRRVSRGVLQGSVIRRVEPIYSPMARSARISGLVQIEVVIDERGNVISATVVQGHPFLSQAALDAAWQWKFRPTLLNGEPIKVTGVLIFNFRL